MNIDQISGNNYSPKKTRESGSSSRTGHSADPENVSNRSVEPKSATQLSLSGSKFKSEVEFAQMVLKHANQKSLDSLPAIRKKIKAGVYDSSDIQKEVGALVKDDLQGLQHIFHPKSPDQAYSRTDAIDLKNKLLDNADVTKHIASLISKDLGNI